MCHALPLEVWLTASCIDEKEVKCKADPKKLRLRRMTSSSLITKQYVQGFCMEGRQAVVKLFRRINSLQPSPNMPSLFAHYKLIMDLLLKHCTVSASREAAALNWGSLQA
jgi:hypothetical protein